MILSSSKEFNRAQNPLIIERPSDNIELPKVVSIDVNVKQRKYFMILLLVISRIDRCSRENKGNTFPGALLCQSSNITSRPFNSIGHIE